MLKAGSRFSRCSACWQRSWMRVFDDESFLQDGNSNIMQKCCEMLSAALYTISYMHRLVKTDCFNVDEA